ncbi:MAG: hypothetical protein US11_C0005G0002 [Candidatus Roizmanbacteria bacterium GW2011_GWA2_36_23]|uniref:Membrane protein 6-pyruvoyl-tetrahydropterin synthase-related domain-containing protein n=1 Tax=Candidatus Roizmanbacteria bacterium GW2011_GWA2_36_23 TaxID=1618480 RepID=A0A0G0HCM3_9BACT|nr:MAG: hypothetical protein US11_C0005G0002 [Candidatus Roizmanbacteria bacterium GW2011_GWA2_36_23]
MFLIVILNAYLYRNELFIKADANDNNFQYALVDEAKNTWDNVFAGKLSPFYLLDSFNERWSEGFPLAMYYSHLPQAAIALLGYVKIITLDQWFNLIKYLMLVLLPVSFFVGARRMGFNYISAVAAAVFSQIIFTDGLYGIDVSSFLWRGWGLSSQLFAVFFLPLAFSYSYGYFSENKGFGKALLFNFLVAESHSGVFFMLALSYIVIFLFELAIKLRFDTAPPINFFKRFFIFCLLNLLILSYFLIPFFFYNNYRGYSNWDSLWKFNSYGWKQIVIWLFNGNIFDFGRLPFISILAALGFFIARKRSEIIFSILFFFYLMLYFGRATFGNLIDVIPGFSEFHLSRFIVMVQFSGIFLAAASIESIFRNLDIVFFALKNFPSQLNGLFKSSKKISAISNITKLIVVILLIYLIYQAEKPIIKYAGENNNLISEFNKKYTAEEKSYKQILDKLKTLPKARVYAGRPGNWGRNMTIGGNQLYMALSKDGIPVIGFAPESWSPNSEYDQFFNEQDKDFYDLYNVGYIVSTVDFTPPDFAKPVFKTGRYQLYEVETNGWFTLAKSDLTVSSDKTNLFNVTKLWMESNQLKNNNYPKISYSEPDYIFGKKSLRMLNEHEYTDEYAFSKSLWNDNPFAIRPASLEAKLTLKKETHVNQTFETTFSLDKDCRNCILVLKNTFHPNWKVVINGKKTKEFAVFPYYLGVELNKAGEYKVTATYSPGNLKMLLLTSELVILGYIFFRRYRKNKT